MKKIVICLFIMLSLFFTSCVDINTRVGVDETSVNITRSTNNSKEGVNSSEDIGNYYKGTIYDTNGEKLMYTTQEDTSTAYRKANASYSLCISNILDESAGITTQTGMFKGADANFNKILTQPNIVPANGFDGIGRSIQLTINAKMQKQIYETLEKENVVGSVVVMRTDGSIAAEVSCPSYDCNLRTSDPQYIDQLNNNEMVNRCMSVATPGSCFKIISEVICDKHGINSLEDTGMWTYDGTFIKNWDWYIYPERYPASSTLEDAFINSSNVYFARAFDSIDKSMLIGDLKNIFLYGDGLNIKCDFGVISNELNITSIDQLRRSAFGQANVKTTPMYLALLVREAVFGEMVRPFILQNVVNTIDYSQIIKKGSKPNDVIANIPNDLRKNINSCMRSAGENLEKSDGVIVPEGYSLFAKTGTAEVGNGYYMYISSCLLADNDTGTEDKTYSNYSHYANGGSYIIILQVQNTEDFGYEYASDMAPLYNSVVNSIVFTEG